MEYFMAQRLEGETMVTSTMEMAEVPAELSKLDGSALEARLQLPTFEQIPEETDWL
jgi:hypothetical protein